LQSKMKTSPGTDFARGGRFTINERDGKKIATVPDFAGQTETKKHGPSLQ